MIIALYLLFLVLVVFKVNDSVIKYFPVFLDIKIKHI